MVNMDSVYSFIEDYKPWLIGAAVIGGIAAGRCALTQWQLYYSITKAEVDRATFTKRDHVYMCVPPRIGTVPNISPFCVKLETWLRMNDISHEVVETLFPSPSKQMFPYIYLNGEEMADSMFIIEKLSTHFDKPMNIHLTDMEWALFIAYSRLLEEHTVITYAWHRYTVGADKFWSHFQTSKGPLSVFLNGAREMMRKSITEKANARGIGRHSSEEIYKIAEEDLRSISIYLGDRKFFFGRQPSVIDCILFAHLVQLIYIQTDFPPANKIFTEFKNLETYVTRMKTQYYPDWDEIC